MSTYLYQDGQLTECVPRTEWSDNMDEGEWLRAEGYEETCCIAAGGNDGELSEVAIYASRRETKFLAFIRLGDDWHTVYLNSIADLIRFRQSYCVPADIRALVEGINTLVQMTEKAFRMWHGHDAQEFCHQCDPQAMEERRARRRK